MPTHSSHVSGFGPSRTQCRSTHVCPDDSQRAHTWQPLQVSPWLEWLVTPRSQAALPACACMQTRASAMRCGRAVPQWRKAATCGPSTASPLPLALQARMHAWNRMSIPSRAKGPELDEVARAEGGGACPRTVPHPRASQRQASRPRTISTSAPTTAGPIAAPGTRLPAGPAGPAGRPGWKMMSCGGRPPPSAHGWHPPS